MKIFFPVLMALVISVGLLVNLTPYVAGFWFPANPEGYQQASTEVSAEALALWFGTQPAEFSQTQAIRWQGNGQKKRWYRFTVNREPVERFIRQQNMEQLPLSQPLLAERFLSVLPPVDWWQPDELARSSYFQGRSGISELRLIYHAEQRTGYLLIQDVLPTQAD